MALIVILMGLPISQALYQRLRFIDYYCWRLCRYRLVGLGMNWSGTIMAGSVRPMFMGTAMASAFFQINRIVLILVAVMIRDRALLLCQHSGSNTIITTRLGDIQGCQEMTHLRLNSIKAPWNGYTTSDGWDTWAKEIWHDCFFIIT